MVVVRVKNQPYPISLRKSLHMIKSNIDVVPVAVNINVYTLDPILEPNRLAAAVGKIEKWPPKQKNERHTDSIYRYLFLAAK